MNTAAATFREVTEQDYEAVIAIRQPQDVFHGFDYLPDYFMMILRTPGYKGFAAHVNGKMIAFEFACLLDEGRTLLGRAGRISKEYSGSGIMQKMTEYIMEYFRDSPNLLYASSTITNERYMNKFENLVKEGKRQLLLRKAILSYRISMNEIHNLLKEQNERTTTKTMSKQDLTDVFASRDLCSEIFPDGRLVVDWVPYQPLASNVNLIFTERCTGFGTNMLPQGRADGALLSFGSYVISSSVVLYNFDIYGQNLNALHDHIISHMKCLSTSFPHNTLQLNLFIYDSLDKAKCDAIVKDLGFNYYDFFAKEQLCTIKFLGESVVSKTKSTL